MAMPNNGPIIIIEDDPDDRELLESIFLNLKIANEILYFPDGEKALDYLNVSDDTPFLILSDINMPRLSGMELKQKIHTDAKLQVKCIPYLFFTTSASRKAVVEAYSMSAQGFFVKNHSSSELEATISIIIDYWKRCISPNQYDEVF
jgi:CheY-like chemotaxis protein